jgi:hypothetical protein
MSTDGGNCSYSLTEKTITDPSSSLTINSITTTPASCEVAKNGKISLNVTSNVGSVHFQIGGVSKTATSDGNLYTLSSFAYNEKPTITVSDDNCTVSKDSPNVIGTKSNQISLSLATTDAPCREKEGTITATTTNGEGYSAYKYVVNGTSYQKQLTQKNFSLSPSPTNYTIQVTDSMGCSDTKSAQLNVSNDSLHFGSVTITPAHCSSSNTGEIKLPATSGSRGIKYSIDGGSQVESSTFEKLLPDVHTITATDEADCQTSQSVTVPVSPSALSIQMVGVTPANCALSKTGTITVSRMSGTGYNDNLTYQVSPGGAASGGNITELLPGQYSVTATDQEGCSASVKDITVPISANTLSLTSLNTQLAACEGSSPTGKLKVMSNGTGFNGVYFTIDTIEANGAKTHSGTEYEFEELKSGNHILYATDGSGCETQITGTVGYASNPVSLLADITDQTCNETNDARIRIQASTVTNGTPQLFRYEYGNHTTNWVSDTTYNVATAGTYHFKVTDKDNCGTAKDITVNNLKKKPTILFDHVDSVACHNATNPNGKLWLYAQSNSTPAPYTYSIQGYSNQTGSTADSKVSFGSLAEGSYKIILNDNLGCKDSAQYAIPVTRDPVHISTIDTTSASCVAAGNGKARITASSYITTNPYTFSCNSNTLNGNKVIFTGLAVSKNNSYTVSVTDQYGCRDDSTFIIRARTDSLNLAYSGLINAACPGSSDGIIKVKRFRGNPDYTYSVSNGSKQFKSEVLNDTLAQITGLPANTYKINVTDADNCQAEVSNITLTEPDTVRFLRNSWNYIKAKGDHTGYTQAQVWKGNNRYNYQWIQMSDNTILTAGKAKNGDTLHLENLKAGTYLLQVQDTAKCFVSPGGWLEKKYVIAEPDTALGLTLRSNRAVSCNGLSDGQFSVKATGGWHNGDNYLYGLNLNTLSTSPAFGSLKAGTVNVLVKDTSGVTTTLPVTITQPDVLTASLQSVTDANCYGSSDGIINLTISGGNAPYYKVSVDSAEWVSGSTLNQLKKGNYTAYVRDTLNCATKVKDLTIKEPDDLVVSSWQVKESRCGYNNGHVVTTITGGIPDYHYQWSSTDNTIVSKDSSRMDSLMSGTYKLMVTDKHNCNRSFTFNVSDSTNLTISALNTTDVSCWGYTDGQASIELTKGNPPYAITWPDSTHLNNVGGLSAGSYSVRVTDAEKCKIFSDFKIGTPDNISLQSYTLKDPLCEGVPDGQISVSPQGSFGGYRYLWDNGQTNATAKNLSPGQYKVTVTDSHNCFNQFGFGLKYQQTVHPSLGRDLALCAGNKALLTPGEYVRYQWGSDNGLSSADSAVTVDKAGSYYVQVKDLDGCIGRDTVNVTQSATTLSGKLLVASNVEQMDTVMVFETSWPIPDSVKFDLPGSSLISYGSYYREVVYATPGTYKIGLTAYRSDCFDYVDNTITVSTRTEAGQKSQQHSVFNQIRVWPNPSSGQFYADISMNSKNTVQVKLASLGSGVILDERQLKGSETYSLNYGLRLASGTYLLYFQCGNEAKTKKIVIL